MEFSVITQGYVATSISSFTR